MAKTQNMVKYVIKRLLLMIPMVFIVLTAVFLLSRILAGDPGMFMFPSDIPLEEREVYLREWGFLDPWWMQLLRYYKDFFTGNLGNSYLVMEGATVLELLAIVFPRTLELMIIPTIIIPIIGVKLGVTAATNQNKTKDQIIRGLGVSGVAFPVFWTGMVLQVILCIFIQDWTQGQLYFPVSDFYTFALFGLNGTSNPVPQGSFSTGFRTMDSFIYNEQVLLQDSIIHLALPIFCMTLVSLASTTRITRTTMLDVLQYDYVRTARAKGCLEKDVYNKHALRNAMIPTSTVIVSSIAARMMGSFLIEQTFNIFGLGYAYFQAIQFRDYFVINAITIYVAILVIVANLVADVLYTIIDPRIVYT
jgi:peptide/nickel transport system permease protein